MRMFLLQIVTPEGHVVRFPGGGPMEADLVARATERTIERGVGLFRTESQVRAALAEGISEAIYELKEETLRTIK